MSIDALVVAIGIFCNLKNPVINKDVKIDCLEAMTNCAVIEDGKTNLKQVEKCKDLWKKRNAK